ncbi:hypothetical protein TEA_001443 [Camellia sinensis var. sinensis]|uniref:RING-type E3 ubiquitin transferase n=1 Tax=Camellia sinensis var. sinensis TaxID=542762 RepID=A0A4V3WR07_CAMSN|nr:hypothetical protein TEA_001443 [Camellia sinensis var. sinensis]
MEISPAMPASQVAGDGDDITTACVDPSSSSSSSSSSPSGSPEKEYSDKAPSKFDDDDEEEDVCRICRNPGDNENPLRYPCACSGSIKFVHQDCLLQWLNHSNARQCEEPMKHGHAKMEAVGVSDTGTRRRHVQDTASGVSP